MGSVGSSIGRGLSAVVSLGGSEIARAAQKRQTDATNAAAEANTKAMQGLQDQQQAFAAEQEAKLKAQPRQEDPSVAYSQELKTRMQRLRAGFAQNLKTGPVGLLTTAQTQKQSLSGQKLLGE